MTKILSFPTKTQMNWELTRTDTRVLPMKWILLSLNWPVIKTKQNKKCRIYAFETFNNTLTTTVVHIQNIHMLEMQSEILFIYLLTIFIFLNN